MELLKFVAPTMREALLKVKEELGSSAVIVRTEQLPGGVVNAGQIEVTASLDESLIAQPEPSHFDDRLKQTLSRIQSGQSPVEDSTAQPSHAEKSLAEEPAASPFQGTYKPSGRLFQEEQTPTIAKPSPSAHSDEPLLKARSQTSQFQGNSSEAPSPQLQRELEKLQLQMKSIQGQLAEGFGQQESSVPPELKRMFKALQHEGLQSSLLGGLIAEYALEVSPKDRSEDHLKDWMQTHLAAKLPIAPPIQLHENRATVMLFLGPTGVGKSTTIAKIAAQQVLSENLSVGIVSTDAYRMGAMEQMAIFAKSAEIDFRAAFSEADIDLALEDLSQKDLILVDSAGRSREHKSHMEELGDIAHYVQADETYLVLAANTRERDLELFYEKFKPFGVNRLVFTKVDETSEMGALWNLPVKKQLPLTYLCHGQTIPDDLIIAQAEEIAQWILLGA